MKVLQINVFHYRLGGSETVYFSTSDLLKQNGNEVAHFALKWNKNLPSQQARFFAESKESRKGLLKSFFNVVNYFYNFDARKKIEGLIKAEKPDVAQIHLFWGQITPSILPVLKKYHIPVIFTIHEYRMVCPAYTFRNGRGCVCEACKGKYFFNCFLLKCCKGSWLMSAVMAAEQYFRNFFFNPVKYIDGLIYVSHFAKIMHEKYMPKLAEKPNIVLHNLSKGFVEKPKKTIPSNKYILYFGRLSYEKGVGTLLEAVVGLSDCNLKVVGTGDCESELKAFAKKRSLGNVEFLGFKTGLPLKELVDNAYFIVVPSEWYENNPMTVIEGFSSAVPVIGAAIGGIPEIVQDGRTGFLFESGSVADLKRCLEKALSLTNEEYALLSENALNFAKDEFNQEKYYPKLKDFYESVLKTIDRNV